jgi:hypothetical protein
MCRAGIVAAIVVNAVAYADARQQSSAPRATDDDGQARAEHAVMESMSGHQMHMASPHMRLTTVWPEQAGDRERAATIVKALRASLEQYRDYHVAERHGYEIFHPEIPQSIFHFTNYAEGFAETYRFTPDAPRNSSENDLNARVPLSVARWHAHINICLPPRGSAANADWKTFGPDGSISTPEACSAAKGRFVAQLFGWMVHVYPFEKTPDKIWGM